MNRSPQRWRLLEREAVHTGAWMTAYRDRVIRPDHTSGFYEWIRCADQVRVAAIMDGTILIAAQQHYLVGDMWQLPGGTVEPGEDPLHAAQRELAEETGHHGGQWTLFAQPHLMPSLSPARVHLYLATDLLTGTPATEPVEADLAIVRVTVAESVAAVHDGRVACAASALLITAVAYKAVQPDR